MASRQSQVNATDAGPTVNRNMDVTQQGTKTPRLVREISKVSDGGGEFERDTDDLSICFLCQQDLNVPKLLPCLHTFCRDCLLTLIRETKNENGTVSCPVCRDGESAQPIENIEALTDNTLVVSMQKLKLNMSDTELQKEPPQDVKCTSCKRAIPATSRCTSCDDFLCKKCTLSHKSSKALKDHELISINEWRKQNEKLSMEERFCPQHNGEPISFYCETCRILICKDCADLDHIKPRHITCSLLEGAVICRRKVDKLLTVSRQTEAKFKGAWEILNEMKSELRETTGSLRTQVQEAFKNERDILDEREKEFLTKTDEIETQREETINTHIDKVEVILEKFWTAFDLTESLMDNGNDFHVLSLEPLVCRRLQSLHKASPDLPQSDLTVIDLMEEPERGTEEEPQPVPQPEDKKQEETPVWELDINFGDRGSGKGQFDWCKGVAASLDCHAIVADWGNDRVQVYDANQQFLCVFNSDNMERGRLSMPHDVACLLDGRFVVVDKSRYAKIYDLNGKFLYRFSTLTEQETNPSDVELSCVTVDRRSRILIGDCKRNVVTVHYVDGTVIRSIPAVAPEHIATTSKDLLVVSCPRKHKVRVMNHEGRFMFQMDTFGAGEKLKPRGVACDAEDNIYVVHKERGGEKSVHMFSNQGKYVACVAKNLREPYDVDIAPSGRVIVSDDDSLKIFTRKDKV